MAVHKLVRTALNSGNVDSFISGLRTIDDIYEFNDHGQNVLHVLIMKHSATSSMIPYIVALIDYGYDLTRPTKNEETALHIASALCKDDIIRLLVAHGIDINILDSDGHPPIFRCGCDDDDDLEEDMAIKTFNTCIELGARLDIIDRGGRSILHNYARGYYGYVGDDDYPYYCHREYPKFFQVVLDACMQAGIDPSIKDTHNGDAMEVARSRSHHTYVQMLQRYSECYQDPGIKEPGD
jgi:ankyrin repeat protein